MCPHSKITSMPRALLTDRERDVITNPESVPKGSRSTLLSRIEAKMEVMAEDARLLREHNPELANELHQAVCKREFDERVNELEAEIQEIKRRLDEFDVETRSDPTGGKDGT